MRGVIFSTSPSDPKNQQKISFAVDCEHSVLIPSQLFVTLEPHGIPQKGGYLYNQ